MPATVNPKSALMRELRAFIGDEGGATAVEYGLLVALIFMVIVAAVQDVGTRAIGLIALYLAV